MFDPYSFRIGDTSKLSPYVGRGIVTQYKKPVGVNARSLSATLQQPLGAGVVSFMFCDVDGSKFMRGINLHLALQAVWQYEAVHGHLPPVGNAEAAAEVVRLAHDINAVYKGVQAHCGTTFATCVDEIDADAVKQFALYYAAELQPLCAFFGGIVAQEIVKVCAKFQPMNQWLHYDCFEVLPQEVAPDTAPTGTRYDHTISVFGAAFQKALGAQSTFLVGTGALGCEFLKNFALLVRCAPRSPPPFLLLYTIVRPHRTAHPAPHRLALCCGRPVSTRSPPCATPRTHPLPPGSLGILYALLRFPVPPHASVCHPAHCPLPSNPSCPLPAPVQGLACDGGTLHCTDNDRIEVSNLNRQFLFRAKNVGKPKSVTAAEAAKAMNPALNVHAMEEVREWRSGAPVPQGVLGHARAWRAGG